MVVHILHKLKNLVNRYSLIINLILICIGCVGLFLVIRIYTFSKDSSPIKEVSENEMYKQSSEETEIKYADIEGQIVNPGVYEISRGETILHLVKKAGGFTGIIDIEYVQKCLNLAEKLTDEQKIYLPAKDENFSCNDNGIGGTSKVSEYQIININTATLEELDLLPGIGPSTAQKIIDLRPYSTLEDLMNVPGIGQATFDKLKDQINL